MREDIGSLIASMEADLARLAAAEDARRYFHATYLRTTRAVADEIAQGGFHDNAWVERWDLVFADLYLDALAADLARVAVPAPWRVAFDAARDRRDLPPLRHVLLGMNAHINFDLPQALVAVIEPAEFDDADRLAARAADHRHIDDVLSDREAAEDEEMGRSGLTLSDRLLRPLNRAATKRILVEARGKVWRNTAVLDRARRRGDAAYRQAVAELERTSAAKLAELVAPGFVLLKLARRGFGVLLSDA
jgi:hypothetical protein